MLDKKTYYPEFSQEVNDWWNNRYIEKDKNNLSDKIHVIIDQAGIDREKINSSNQSIKKFIYRPQTLQEYIGQENAKNLIALNIRKIETLKPVHFLINGPKGHGKSTVAYIIKNLLKTKMIERVGKQIACNDDIVNIVNEINGSIEKNVILFIDEIHSLDPALCEIFYPLMEDYCIVGKNVKPFILIGCTTEKNLLLKSNSPMVDRFQVQVELQRYSNDEIVQILTQYKAQLYPDYIVSNEFIQTIAKNAKNTPRIAISLLEDGIIEPDVNHVLKCHRIVYNGLNETDVAILRILIQNEKPLGSKALSQMVGISERDYIEENESYLVSKELILRTARGRTIASKGKEIYEKIINRRTSN